MVVLDGMEIFDDKCLPAQSSLLAAVLKLIDSVIEKNKHIIGLINGESVVTMHPSLTQPYRLGSIEEVPPLTATEYETFLVECFQAIQQTTSTTLFKRPKSDTTRQTSYSADLAIATMRNGLWEGTLTTTSQQNTHTTIPTNHTQPKQPFDFGYEQIKNILLEWFQSSSWDCYCPTGKYVESS